MVKSRTSLLGWTEEEELLSERWTENRDPAEMWKPGGTNELMMCSEGLFAGHITNRASYFNLMAFLQSLLIPPWFTDKEIKP